MAQHSIRSHSTVCLIDFLFSLSARNASEFYSADSYRLFGLVEGATRFHIDLCRRLGFPVSIHYVSAGFLMQNNVQWHPEAIQTFAVFRILKCKSPFSFLINIASNRIEKK